MNTGERVKELVKALGISVRKFEESIGASNGYVTHLRKNIDADKMSAILEKYPNVNPTWLQYEIGNMFLQSGDSNNQIFDEIDKKNSAPENLNKTLYQKLISVMEEQIQMLKQEKKEFLEKHGCASYSELDKKMKDLQNTNSEE